MPRLTKECESGETLVCFCEKAQLPAMEAAGWKREAYKNTTNADVSNAENDSFFDEEERLEDADVGSEE